MNNVKIFKITQESAEFYSIEVGEVIKEDGDLYIRVLSIIRVAPDGFDIVTHVMGVSENAINP